ncbi:MAG: hypothetical protein CMP51_02930 [Flavobacteriales bacterium]|nr:hypothetical protein [Flavobacteriales bacterium]|tara:strand:- start:225 stop:1112 length:888 start_codon:yes stop_codon:yes gene_type:complete
MKLKTFLLNKSQGFKLTFFFVIVLCVAFFTSLFMGFFIEDDIKKLISNIFDQRVHIIINFLFILILPVYILSFFERTRMSDLVGLNSNFINKQVLFLIMSIISIQPFIVYTVYLNSEFIFSVFSQLPEMISFFEKMEEQANAFIQNLLNQEGYHNLTINIVLLAILPAIGEELFFRGIIQKKLTYIIINPHLAILITSIVFSAIHLQFFGFLPRLILGLALGYFFYYSKNLWMPILAHFTHNALSVFALFFTKHELSETPLELNEDNINLPPVFASIFFFVIFFYLFIKVYKNEK